VIARTQCASNHAFDLIEAAATSFATNADPDPDRKPTLCVVSPSFRGSHHRTTAIGGEA
jgi:hypothetical protein